MTAAPVQPPSPWHRLAWCTLPVLPAVALAVAWGSAAVPARTTLLAHVLYWLTPAVLLLWIGALVRRVRAAATPWRAWLQHAAPALLAAALATAAVFVAVPPAMRVQFDEASLLGTARAMHLDRVAMMATGAVPGADGAWVVDWNLDKRPPLFAFLVSAVHDLTGLRVANAFAVNAAVLFALLAALACRVRTALGTLAAIATPCLVLGAPIVTVAATSAGFDLLAVLLLSLVVGGALDFRRDPTPVRAGWLLASAFVFALARYESLLVVAVLAALVGAAVRRWPRDRFGRWLGAAAPTVVTTLALLLVHGRDRAFYFEAEGQALAGFGHLATHTVHLLGTFFATSAPNPFPGPLAAVGLAAAIVWLWRHRERTAAAFVLAPVAAVTTIALAWFYGDAREPTAARLFLPLALASTLGPLLALACWPRRAFALALLALAVPWAALRVHAVAAGTVLPRNQWALTLDAVDATLAQLAPDPRRTLLVSTVAQYLCMRGHAAVPPAAYLRGRGRNAADVVVLETTLDAQLARQVGDPKEVLRGSRVLPLTPQGQATPILAWRLQ